MKKVGINVTNPNMPDLQTYTFGSRGTFAKGVAVGAMGIVAANNCAQGFMSCQLGGSVSVNGGAVYPSGGVYANAVAIGDVNGDGLQDIVVANGGELPPPAGPGAVGVLLGGSFQPTLTYGPGSSSVALADLNSDGKLDIVLSGGAVLLGNGDGTFQAQVPEGISGGGAEVANTNSDGKGVAIADLNSDGKLDIVAIGGGVVWAMLGNGDGTFQPGVAYGSGGITTGVAIADLNRDGIPDLAVSNCGGDCYMQTGVLGALLGNGDGTFKPVVTYSAGALTTDSIVAVDLNLDGKPDLVAVSEFFYFDGFGAGAVGVLLGNGDGTFQTALVYSSGGLGGLSVTAADVDGDGRPDLIVGNACQINSDCPHGGGVVAVMLNRAWTTTTSLVSSANPSLVNSAVTYTGRVTSQSGGTVTGTVTFRDGERTIATVPLVDNQGAYSTSYTRPMLHTITATYSGDGSNAGSASDALAQQIVKPFPTETVLTTSRSPEVFFYYVYFTVTVTSTAGPIPEGESVTFYDGATFLDTKQLWAGTTMYMAYFPTVRMHMIRAVYGGDALFKPSSGFVKQVIIRSATTTYLQSSPNGSEHGQPVTFTATVEWNGPFLPTGRVRFMEGTNWVGVAALTQREGYWVATVTTRKLSVGTHPITAEFLGDSTYAKSTSNVVNQEVQ
jgi:hypothetical protein